jgi:hypothetical protein
MSWRSACWGLALVTLGACNQKSADSEPTDGPLMTGPQSTPFPCEVGAAIQRNCWDCHGPVLNHAAPMPLTSYESVHQPTRDGSGEQIFQRIAKRIHDIRDPMPPSAICAPGGPCKPTAQEMATLDAWIAAGAPAGTGCGQPPPPPPGAGGNWMPPGVGGAGNVPNYGGQGGITYYPMGGSSGIGGSGNTTSTGGAYNPPPLPDGGTLPPILDDVPVPPDPAECDNLDFHGRQDASGAPFQVPSGEHYFCFSFHYPLQPGAQGLGFYKDIDNSNVIHHWLLYKMTSAQNNGAWTECLGTHPDGELIAGWALGGGDWFLPKHVGMELGGGDFILEIHYNNTGAPTTDKSGVHVCNAKTPRPESASLSWLGADIWPIGSGLLIPPGATPQNYAAKSTCAPANTQDIHILRSWPHMHLSGAQMRSTINRKDGTKQTLIDRPFSFNDQRQYDTPALLHPGDTITTECMYDNKTGAQIPFGESTTQEMCYNFIVAYPARALIMPGHPLHSTACIPSF